MAMLLVALSFVERDSARVAMAALACAARSTWAMACTCPCGVGSSVVAGRVFWILLSYTTIRDRLGKKG